MSKAITEEEANTIKERHSKTLLGFPGVCRIGVEKDNSGEFFLKVGIDRKAPIPTLPTELDGLKVIAESTDSFMI